MKVIPTFSCETAKLEVADMANPLRISFRNGNLFQASKRLLINVNKFRKLFTMPK